MKTWRISLNSSNCPSRLKAHGVGNYNCSNSFNNSGFRCVEKECPLASQPSVEADANSEEDCFDFDADSDWVHDPDMGAR